MKNVLDDWFVRENVNRELNDKIVQIANTMLEDAADEEDERVVV